MASANIRKGIPKSQISGIQSFRIIASAVNTRDFNGDEATWQVSDKLEQGRTVQG